MAKKKEGDVPRDLRDSANKIWLAGLGALATAEEEGGKLFRNLVEKGKGFESKTREQVDKAGDRVQEAREKAGSVIERLGDEVDERIAAAVHRLGVPTREEISSLTQRIEELTAKVERLKKG